MEYDNPKTIPFETKSDTPDIEQECLRISEAIDVHIDAWFDLAEQNSAEEEADPNRHRTELSRIIIAQCTPLKKSPEDIISAIRFRGEHSEIEIRRLSTLIRNQNQLAAVANDPAYDSGDIEIPVMARSFMYVEMAQHNPNSNPNLRLALTYLHRLYIAREAIAIQQGEKNFMQEAGEFSHILKKIIDEN